MSDTTVYNGHANYQTWVTSVWLDDDRWSSDFWRETALKALRDNEGDENLAITDVAGMLKEHLEEEADAFIDRASLMSDLLTSAIEDVDFREIAEGYVEESMAEYLEEVGEEEEEEEEEDGEEEGTPPCP